MIRRHSWQEPGKGQATHCVYCEQRREGLPLPKPCVARAAAHPPKPAWDRWAVSDGTARETVPYDEALTTFNARRRVRR